MKTLAAKLAGSCGLVLIALLLAAAAPGHAWAGGGGWHGGGGGWHGGGGGWHGGGGGYGGGWRGAGWYRPGWYGGPRVFVGVGPYWGPWPYAYPYYGFPYRYYAPPVVVAPTPVVVQPPPPPVYVQPPQQYWYYCQNPAGYYPEVNQCPGGWTPVAPQPAGPTQ